VPRNMSFSMTTEQVRNGTRPSPAAWAGATPTRRTAVGGREGAGLRKGEKIKRIRMIRVVSIEAEPLEDLYEYPDARRRWPARGFRAWSPGSFLHLFCEYNGVTLNGWVNRIEFGLHRREEE